MKRRNFIVGMTGVAVVSIPTVYYFVSRDMEFDPLISKPRSLSQIWDSETITAVGNQYIVQVPSENKERRLVKMLLKGPSNKGEDPDNKMKAKIKKDFEDGNTILVNGWVLSVTEARQCALYSIIKTQ